MISSFDYELDARAFGFLEVHPRGPSRGAHGSGEADDVLEARSPPDEHVEGVPNAGHFGCMQRSGYPLSRGNRLDPEKIDRFVDAVGAPPSVDLRGDDVGVVGDQRGAYPGKQSRTIIGDDTNRGRSLRRFLPHFEVGGAFAPAPDDCRMDSNGRLVEGR